MGLEREREKRREGGREGVLVAERAGAAQAQVASWIVVPPELTLSPIC